MISLPVLHAIVAAGANGAMVLAAVEAMMAEPETSADRPDNVRGHDVSFTEQEAISVARRRKDAERKRRWRAEQRRMVSEPETSADASADRTTSADRPDNVRGQTGQRPRTDHGRASSSNESSSLQSSDVDVGDVDAPVRDPVGDLTIREEATVLASEVMTILGIDQEFIPPSWCGAALWFEAGLRGGWKPDIVRIAAQRVAKTKRDGPPNSFRYLGKPIANEHALAAAPLPTADLHHLRTGDANAQPRQRSVQDVARDLVEEARRRCGASGDQRQRELPLLRSVS